MLKPAYDYVLKFIIIGDSSVGKSNIMSRFTNSRYQCLHDMTIGVEFASKIVSESNINYKLQIWDTSGQEAYKSTAKLYYRGAIGCLIVYDVTDRRSFEEVMTWLNDIRNLSDPQIVIALVGNKLDIRDDRKVSSEEGREFADTNGLIFFETSAKTGYNIENCFTEILHIIGKKIESKDINMQLCKSATAVNLNTQTQSSWCYC